MSEVVLLILFLLFVQNMDTFLLSSSANDNTDIYMGKMEEFSKTGIVALHFPCKESNMFSTNCACHIKCTSNKCENALEICQKYQSR